MKKYEYIKDKQEALFYINNNCYVDNYIIEEGTTVFKIRNDKLFQIFNNLWKNKYTLINNKLYKMHEGGK